MPWLFLVLVILAGGAGMSYWFIARGDHRPSLPQGMQSTGVSSSKPPPALSTIVTGLPARRDFALRLPWTGQVQSQMTVQVVTLAAGRVEAVLAGDQTSVTVGAPLFRLGGPRVEAARAELKIKLEGLTRRLDLTRQAVRRQREALQNRLATQQTLADTEAAQAQLESDLQTARQALKTLEAQLLIAAPAAGVFTNRRVSVGQEVNAGDVLVEILAPDRLRIAATLFPPMVIPLQGLGAMVRLDQDTTLSAAVEHVLPQGAPSGAAQVWLTGPAIGARLRPGESVSGEITIQTRRGALAVPASAIVYDAREEPLLFVQRQGGYERRNVRLGLIQEGWAEVRSGLGEREPVVTQGAYELFYQDFNRQFKVAD
jgi:RND family efflux transporter MFP subunit